MVDVYSNEQLRSRNRSDWKGSGSGVFGGRPPASSSSSSSRSESPAEGPGGGVFNIGNQNKEYTCNGFEVSLESKKDDKWNVGVISVNEWRVGSRIRERVKCTQSLMTESEENCTDDTPFLDGHRPIMTTYDCRSGDIDNNTGIAFAAAMARLILKTSEAHGRIESGDDELLSSRRLDILDGDSRIRFEILQIRRPTDNYVKVTALGDCSTGNVDVTISVSIEGFRSAQSAYNAVKNAIGGYNYQPFPNKELMIVAKRVLRCFQTPVNNAPPEVEHAAILTYVPTNTAPHTQGEGWLTSIELKLKTRLVYRSWSVANMAKIAGLTAVVGGVGLAAMRRT